LVPTFLKCCPGPRKRHHNPNQGEQIPQIWYLSCSNFGLTCKRAENCPEWYDFSLLDFCELYFHEFSMMTIFGQL
jgi:hypothetical protein